MQIWSLDALPDGSGFVSASADKYIRLWRWTKVAGADGAAARLSIEQDKAINTGQDVLCVRVSPDGNLIAASLISNVIKVCLRSSALHRAAHSSIPDTTRHMLQCQVLGGHRLFADAYLLCQRCCGYRCFTSTR